MFQYISPHFAYQFCFNLFLKTHNTFRPYSQCTKYRLSNLLKYILNLSKVCLFYLNRFFLKPSNLVFFEEKITEVKCWKWESCAVQ